MNITAAQEVINKIEPIKRTGLIFESVETNKLIVRMPLEGNANHNGIMYAGSLFSLAECAPGVLFMNHFGTSKKAITPVCGGVNIRFRRPAMTDITLELTIDNETFVSAEKQVTENGKAVFDFTQNLTDAKGEVVAIAEVKYVLMKF